MSACRRPRRHGSVIKDGLLDFVWGGQIALPMPLPERDATLALGHTTAVHRAYARVAQGELYSPEVYEAARRSARIFILKFAAEVPLPQ